jgi:hypothetical protein
MQRQLICFQVNLELSAPVLSSANHMNKLSLVGMRLPEKYIKKNFNDFFEEFQLY